MNLGMHKGRAGVLLAGPALSLPSMIVIQELWEEESRCLHFALYYGAITGMFFGSFSQRYKMKEYRSLRVPKCKKRPKTQGGAKTWVSNTPWKK